MLGCIIVFIVCFDKVYEEGNLSKILNVDFCIEYVDVIDLFKYKICIFCIFVIIKRYFFFWIYF